MAPMAPLTGCQGDVPRRGWGSGAEIERVLEESVLLVLLENLRRE
ncbi:MAG: hypothetical protein ACRDQZ_01445 [Mycobacteriales bacterium]